MSARPSRTVFPGDGNDPFVIAEIGVNHDGDPERAMELVDLAAGVGADAVKLQWFQASSLVSSSAGLVQYQREQGEVDAAAMLRRLELEPGTMGSLLERAHARGMAAIVTVFSHQHVGEAAAMDWDFFKTASTDLVNRPLLEALARDGRPLIISTGCSELEEISEALRWVAGRTTALLHCVSSYPTPPEHAALAGIGVLAESFPLPVGYSDHTGGWETGGLAVAAGATILEKHLTWSRSAPGPDHACSLEPEEFKRYVDHARQARRMLGEHSKHVLPIEMAVREGARQSIVACRDLHAGDVLVADDLATMRPGTGLRPALLPDLLGRRLVRDVEAGVLLEMDDLDPSEVRS